MENKHLVSGLKICFWSGALFDGMALVPLLFPRVAIRVLGLSDVPFDANSRYVMGIAAALMAGWTVLLVWASRKPVERKGILLLTVCPVLVGLAAAGGYAVASGLVRLEKMLPLWIVQFILAVLFCIAYVRAHHDGSR